MVFSHSLASRIRDCLVDQRAITERRMFGGVAFMLAGHMCVGVWRNSLIARLGPDQAADALKLPNVFPFDITGRPMKGWVLVEPEGIETDVQLRQWIDQTLSFVRELPPKKPHTVKKSP